MERETLPLYNLVEHNLAIFTLNYFVKKDLFLNGSTAFLYLFVSAILRMQLL